MHTLKFYNHLLAIWPRCSIGDWIVFWSSGSHQARHPWLEQQMNTKQNDYY